MRRWIVVALAWAGACSSTGTQEAAPELGRIATLEDARTTHDSELIELAGHARAEVRERAAIALGRLAHPEGGVEVTRALLERLRDGDARVRAAAAFSLGMRGDASAADALLFVALDEHERDADAVVRARAIEAASKLDRPELRARMLEGLRDDDARVRLETAQGAGRWGAKDDGAAAVNARLVEHLATERDEGVVTYTLFALERRKASEARLAFLLHLRSKVPEQRVFAVRGLAALAPDPEVREALCAAALRHDGGINDWRVRAEAALGLGSCDAEDAWRALGAATIDESAHVRRNAWEALGKVMERNLGAYAFLQGIGVEARQLGSSANSTEGSAWVRAAMYEAGLRSLVHATAESRSVEHTLELVGQAYRNLTREERIGVLRGIAVLDETHALPVLLECIKDPDFAVGAVAIELLPRFKAPRVREALHAVLAYGDNGLRLAAVTALAEIPDASDVEPLERCYMSSQGDGTNEIRFNALRAAAKADGARALPMLLTGVSDDCAFVRRVAREELARLDPAALESVDALALDFGPDLQPLELPRHERNPIVDVVTSKGTLRFELFPQETPLHVHNFLEQAARDHYDGTPWHRVVSDFVIQGGDYRRDGNGGGTWRGPDDSLRHEIGPRKYVRGSLGMPRNEDPDSGGSQIFVTHRATPHLDGRYTIFGELREGFDVLDAIEVGDGIIDVVRVR